MAYTAAGRFDGYWQRGLNYWDIAAGIIITKEAGGFVNNLNSNTFTHHNIDIVASNTKIYKDLTKLL